MDYKFKQENYNFWAGRIKTKPPEQICTNDVELAVLEAKQILSKLRDGTDILEIGCGNGLLYEDIRNQYQVKGYLGTDFVKELIDICKNKIRNKNDEFRQLDMTEVNPETFDKKFDFIISRRAIQNVIDKELQLEVIDNLGYFLQESGLMILVESSQTAQDRINLERDKYGLNPLTPPFHNLFLDDDRLKNQKFENVKLIEISPFSSDFYFITRIIYSRYAKEFLGECPTYEHPLQKIALSMSEKTSTSVYSQIKTYVFQKTL